MISISSPVTCKNNVIHVYWTITHMIQCLYLATILLNLPFLTRKFVKAFSIISPEPSRKSKFYLLFPSKKQLTLF